MEKGPRKRPPGKAPGLRQDGPPAVEPSHRRKEPSEGSEAQPGPPFPPDGNGRDDKGRFRPGNAASVGHKGPRKMVELRQAILDATTPETLGLVSQKLAVLALEGDVSAARLLFEYCAGRPVQGVEISGPEGEPLGRSAELASALGEALGGYPDEIRYAILAIIKRSFDAHRNG